MLFLIFVYYSTHSIVASPIQPIDSRSFEPNPCTNLTHCRTIWNIIWSCLTTIFSCTWVSVHPNIPSPKQREAKNCFQRWIRNPLLSFAEHRLPLFVCALLVPEYVLAWAIRQHLRAREIARDNEARQWSITHGFFVIMGGFHLFERDSEEKSGAQSISQEGDHPLHPLLASDLTRDDVYSFAMPTQAEIDDKGKSDWLAKSLVLLQTSWFVTQCIARAIEHLPVTHLEIVTLAYAAMNFVIYTFWWNKPLNVNRPVRVYRRLDPGTTDTGIELNGSEESEPRETQPQAQEPVPDARKLVRDTIFNGLGTTLLFVIGLQDEKVDLSREDRVPRFWANNSDDNMNVAMADVTVLGVGICFGAIHCIAWSFSFPTRSELLIWRISTVAITVVPVYIPLISFLVTRLRNMGFEIAASIAGVSILPAGMLYIIARGVTLVLVFTSLRGLPPGAFGTVHWTTFMLHV